MRLLDRSGSPILSLEQWTRPKRSHYWREGRSAMELARAWCPESGPSCPKDFQALLDSHEWTRNLELDEVRPEHVTPLPERGEGRNHDLWARGRNRGRIVTLCVEAKVDEPFGDTVQDTCAAALAGGEEASGVARAGALVRTIFGPKAAPDREPYASLRYQLVTAVAGTALQAVRDGADQAAFIIHEFDTGMANAGLLQRNDEDLRQFITVLNGGRPVELAAGSFVGPWRIHAGTIEESGVQLLIGKVRTRTTQS